MNIPERTRYIGDEDVLQVWWFVNGSLVNYASGYTFTLKVATVADPTTVLFTKTSGFTGAAGGGVEGSGTPNLSVAWLTAGELNSLTDAGRYLVEITALKVSDSSESTYQMTFNMKKRLG